MTAVKMTRREAVLGGAAALAAAALPLGAARPVLGQAPAPPHRLRKCISMSSHAPLNHLGHPHDFRLHGNREYIRDLSGTRWVKLWVSWADLQRAFRPRDRAESWAQLNTAPAGRRALRILDGQIAALNADGARPGGMGVILTLYQDYPPWAGGSGRLEPAAAGKPLEARLPDDLTPAGPWAWFVAHLCARYRRGAAPNPFGPHEPAIARGGLRPYEPGAGNPDGAWIDAVEICNEPNLLLWPQAGIHERVADMVETASIVAAAEGGPLLLAPGTADTPDPPHEGRRATNWHAFTERLLGALAERRLAAPVAWSHHNYRDVTRGVDRRDSRVRAVLDLLDAAGWRGPGGPRLWLTEGGVNLHPRENEPGVQARHAELIERNFAAMAAEPDVFMWTQHTIHDVPGNTYKSGLRNDFVWAVGPGRIRPAWEAWRRLPGAPAK